MQAQCTIGLIVILIFIKAQSMILILASILHRRLEFFVISPKGHPLKELVDEGEPQQQYEELPLFIVPEATQATTRPIKINLTPNNTIIDPLDRLLSKYGIPVSALDCGAGEEEVVVSRILYSPP